MMANGTEASSIQGCGTIKKISMINFMCHDNLEIDLNVGLNVITGSNGSSYILIKGGKSAILAGLVFALGGRASTTSRGTNLRDLIKINRRSASVNVQILNSGFEGFKTEIYGDVITVERKVTSSGISTYKTINSDGLVITRLREEVMALLDHYNIQVENPINILNQDHSKTFLNDRDPGQKYKLFMNATNLVDVYNDYLETKQQAEIITQKLDKKVKSSKNFKDYLDTLTSKLLLSDELTNIDRKLESLKHKMTSREIINLELEVVKIEGFLTEQQSKLDKLCKLEQTTVQELDREENDYQALKREASETEGQITHICQRKQEYRHQIGQMTESIQRKKINCQTTEVEIKNYKLTLDNFKQSFKATGQQEQFNRREKLLEQKSEKTSNYNKLHEEFDIIKEKIETTQQRIQIKKSERDKLTQEERQIKYDLTNVRKRLAATIESSKDRRNIFGSFTQRLHEKIAICVKNKEFEIPPVGPIGSLITITDERWLLSVEICLKDLLRSYIVFNFRDRNLLQKLMRDTCKPNEIPTIIISSYQQSLYDYKVNTPKSTYPTMMDILKSQNHNVLNVLIDQVSLERILCIENVSDARQVMIPSPPQNASRAFTLDGDEIISVDGRSRFYSSDLKAPRYLVKDLTQVIQSLKEECTAIENKHDSLSKEIKLFDEPISELEAVLSKINYEEKRAGSRLSRLQQEIKELDSELEGLEEIDQTSFDKEVMALEQTIKTLESTLQTYTGELDEMQTTYNRIKVEYDTILSQISQFQAKWDKIKEQSNQKIRAISKLTGDTKGLQETITNTSGKIAEINDQLSDLHKSINFQRHQLPKGAFIRTEESLEDIKIEITKLETAAKTIQISPLEIEKLKSEYNQISKTYNDQITKINELKLLAPKLESMLAVRLNDYVKLREFVVVQAQSNFQAFLEYRGYDGSLKFDHEAQKLYIDVSSIGDTSISKNTKCLSGGEKSFSTLSFVISLWESTDSPFRFLDEFDVFMDVINRKTALNLLKDYATSHHDQQLVLITPQDVSDLLSNPDVTVIKMDDPR